MGSASDSFLFLCSIFSVVIAYNNNSVVIAYNNNSDYEILAALQTMTVETVVRTQRHPLDADKFPMFSGGRTWQRFCRDLYPCWV